MRFFAIFLFAVLVQTTGFSQWTQTSGPAGAQSDEIFHVGNYLIANSINGGIFRSSDKALAWQSINNGLPPEMRCYGLDIENNNLYVVTSHGVYYSLNFGDSWDKISGSEIVGFSIEVSGNEIFVGYHNGVLYYSPDHGGTWVTKYTTPYYETTHQILKIGSALWLGTDKHDLLYSPDNGVTWNKHALSLVVSDLTTNGTDIFISGNNVGTFTVYRSSDQGVSFAPILTTPETNVASSGFLQVGSEMFVTGSTQFYYSANNGTTWVTHPLLPGFTVSMSSIASIDNDLFVSYGEGILFSADKGVTWVRRNSGYRNHIIPRINKTNSAVVSLSETNGVFVSSDNGNYWKAVHDPDLFLPRHIYANNNSIIMSYDLVVYKSMDNGQTWQLILTPDVAGVQAIVSPHPSGSGESLVVTSSKGVYFSRNMGGSWNFVPKSTFGSYDLLKGFVQGDTVVVLTQEEMFLSTDFGKIWQKKTVPVLPVLNFSITDIIVDKSTIIMSTSNGLYKSPDFGITWKKMQYIPEPIIFDMEKINDRLILATYRGIFVSGTNGVGWYAVNNGLNAPSALSILVSDPFTYVGTMGKSVWRIPTAELLTVREFIDVGGIGVPTPLVSAECSTLTVSNSTKDVLIRWYKNGALIPNQSDQRLQATGEGGYSASFENETDIKTSEVIQVKEADKTNVEVYNAITVNGDGKNDTYFVDEELTGSRLQVINRWGEIVYSNNSYHNEWSPDQLSPGQYFYLIESTCLGKFKGVLTIIK